MSNLKCCTKLGLWFFNVLFVTSCSRVLVACHSSFKSGVLVLSIHASPWAMFTMVNVAPHHLFFSLSGTYKELWNSRLWHMQPYTITARLLRSFTAKVRLEQYSSLQCTCSFQFLFVYSHMFSAQIGVLSDSVSCAWLWSNVCDRGCGWKQYPIWIVMVSPYRRHKTWCGMTVHEG